MIKDPHSNATPATSTSASKWPQVLATLAGKKCHSVCKLTKMSQLCHRERSELHTKSILARKFKYRKVSI